MVGDCSGERGDSEFGSPERERLLLLAVLSKTPAELLTVKEV